MWQRTGHESETGLSLIELVVVLAIAMTLVAVSLPALMHSYNSIRLSNAAYDVKDILILTRAEAINRNKMVDCVIQTNSSNPAQTNMWSDPDRDGVLDPTETMRLLTPAGNLINTSSAAGTASLTAQAVNGAAVATPSPTNSKVTFDARGAVTSVNVNVFYLSNVGAPEAGFRAVLLMPSGATQVWSGDSSGNWQMISP